MKKKEAIGVLPSDAWLKRNGYRELVEAMEKYPEKFKHIKKNKDKQL